MNMSAKKKQRLAVGIRMKSGLFHLSSLEESLKKIPKRALIYVTLNGTIVLLACVSFAIKSVAMKQRYEDNYPIIHFLLLIALSFTVEKVGAALYYSGVLQKVLKKKRFDSQDSSKTVFRESVRSMLTDHAVLDTIEFIVSMKLLSLDGAASYNTTPLTVSFIVREFLGFIPKSVISEIVFDFFHYWTHRICHMNKFLFKYVHHAHHTQTHTGIMSSFIMHPLDYFATNVVPTWLTILLTTTTTTTTTMLTMSPFQLQLFLTYKVWIEIGGHSGVEGKGLFSLIQFPILGWCTEGIALHTRDHSWHHLKPTHNFGKRTAIWDNLFGTYESSGSFDPRSGGSRQNGSSSSVAKEQS